MKTTKYFVVGLLLISSLTALSIGKEAGEYQETISLSFNDLEVFNSNIEQFVELNFGGASGVLYQQSQPILPIYSKKLTLPFGTEIEDIECNVGNIKTMTLSNKVIPAPNPVTPDLDAPTEIQYIMDDSIYNSNELYPTNWFDYYVGVGLDENKVHKTFLIVRAFPVRYSPGTDTLNYIENIELTVSYLIPDSYPFPANTDYELAIIAPQKFKSELQKLVTHKESKGVTTLLKTTEDIYSEYTGADKPEQIKLFIKDALETYNITYVMLVGGLNSLLNAEPRDDKSQGSKDWYVPVRYTYNREQQGLFDPGFLSDLYYADIYKEGGEFDDWDSNNNGVFAEWYGINKDVLDFYPDVYVGRLACRNIYEVRIMVNKIINYEKKPAGDWYDTMILCGGDSFDDVGTNYLEGEVVSERMIDDYMTEFTPVKMYASNKDSKPKYTCEGSNIIREISKGAGHLFLDGHASPFTWTTHWPGEFEGGDSWTERFWIWDFPWMLNGGKLPLCAVEGCHNSQFNVSIIKGLQDTSGKQKTWCYGQPIPECWSWWLARKIGGGSISTIGNTGLGYGAVGEHGDIDGDGIVEPDVLEAFGGLYFDQYYKVMDSGADRLGDCHSGALTSYLDIRPGMGDKVDAKTMEQMVLLGDPSLKIGGYGVGTELRAEIADADAGVLGAPFSDVMFQASAYNAQGETTFNWDLDNDGQYDDATGEIASNVWYLPGVYWVGLKVTDETGQSDYYDTVVEIAIGADKPARPSGETIIKPGVEYTYSSIVNTQGGYWNKIFYKFSWGDGTETNWIESSSASHIWSRKGTYNVKAKALLIHESDDKEDYKETDWSDPLTIKLSKSKTGQSTIFELILQHILEKYPNAFPIIRQLLGL
ncbi:hypothetical protein AYK20_05510 [Thermoplasmatales archaeon SG8-52-1]|nr:MAG: hypothetical protein AYK20_05510 [Thermoplasmatales archaeon SG8-52-1]